MRASLDGAIPPRPYHPRSTARQAWRWYVLRVMAVLAFCRKVPERQSGTAPRAQVGLSAANSLSFPQDSIDQIDRLLNYTLVHDAIVEAKDARGRRRDAIGTPAGRDRSVPRWCNPPAPARAHTHKHTQTHHHMYEDKTNFPLGGIGSARI